MSSEGVAAKNGESATRKDSGRTLSAAFVYPSLTLCSLSLVLEAAGGAQIDEGREEERHLWTQSQTRYDFSN